METILSAVFVLYALAILKLSGALTRNSKSDHSSTESELTVIIPFRNEAANIGSCLQSLLQQDTEALNLQILAVNDRSTDGGPGIVQQFAASNPDRIQLLNSEGAGGKKRAIMAGLEESRHAIIAILDADSQVQNQWATTVLAAFDENTGLVASPVTFKLATHKDASPTLFSRVLQTEYAALLGAGLAAMNSGKAMYASGTNLAWRKSVFEEVGGYNGLEDIPSGDDTLLIQRISTRSKWKIRAHFDPVATVVTRAPASFRELLTQRIRWNSTEKHYPDRGALFAAIAVYALLATLPVCLLLYVLGHFSLATLQLLVLLKLLPDLWLAHRSMTVFGLKSSPLILLLAWCLQLGYALVVPWAGLRESYGWREQ